MIHHDSFHRGFSLPSLLFQQKTGTTGFIFHKLLLFKNCREIERFAEGERRDVTPYFFFLPSPRFRIKALAKIRVIVLKTEITGESFWRENKVQRAKVTLDQTLESHWRHSVAKSCFVVFPCSLVCFSSIGSRSIPYDNGGVPVDYVVNAVCKCWCFFRLIS